MASERRFPAIVIAKKCWTILVLLGLAYYLWANGRRIVNTAFTIPGNDLGVALLCIVIGKLSAIYVMWASLKVTATRLTSWRDIMWVYASADVAKYIPGGVWAIMGRVVQYRNYGMSAEAMSKALVLENIIVCFCALPLALPVCVLLFAEQGWLTPALGGGVLVLAVLVTLGAVMFARRFDLLKSMRPFIGVAPLASIVMMIGWVAMGTSFFMLLPGAQNLQLWLWAIGSYATAFVAGMVAVFAPAGAGVREGVLVLIGQLSGMSSSAILDAAILNRAIWVIADTCVFFWATVIRLSGK